MMVWRHAPARKFRKIKQFGAFWSIFCLKIFPQNYHFDIKKNDFTCTLAMGYYTSRKFLKMRAK